MHIDLIKLYHCIRSNILTKIKFYIVDIIKNRYKYNHITLYLFAFYTTMFTNLKLNAGRYLHVYNIPVLSHSTVKGNNQGGGLLKRLLHRWVFLTYKEYG